MFFTGHRSRQVAALLSFMPFAAFAAGADLEVNPLSGDIYLHTSYKLVGGDTPFPSNGLVLVDGDSAVLVDTAWPEADTPKLVAWIESRGLELKAAVVTHSHDDRTSGLAYLNEKGVSTYASAATNALLASAGQATALHTFEDSAAELAALGIEVFFPGAAHAPDNHAVWIADEGVLFGGCMVRSASTQSLGNTADASLDEWPRSLARLLEQFPGAKIVVPGHGKPGSRDLVTHSIGLFEPGK